MHSRIGSFPTNLMPISFCFCYDCYTWVQPREERCPDCKQTVQATANEPPTHALRRLVGEVRLRLGEVHVRRKLLPSIGVLYLTDGGLFFAPHQTEQISRWEPKGNTASVFWLLGSLLWSPLALLWMFRGDDPDLHASRVAVLRPRDAFGNQFDLPELLVSEPGAFFVPAPEIREIQSRRGTWSIVRRDAPAWKFAAMDETSAFRERMHDLQQG